MKSVFSVEFCEKSFIKRIPCFWLFMISSHHTTLPFHVTEQRDERRREEEER